MSESNTGYNPAGLILTTATFSNLIMLLFGLGVYFMDISTTPEIVELLGIDISQGQGLVEDDLQHMKRLANQYRAQCKGNNNILAIGK
jgi:hypothetical protein